MKKLLSAFLAIITMLSLSVFAFAADAKLNAENISVKAGETFDVTYKLSNNPGIMGFSFTFSFDESALEAVCVKRSDSFNGGVFNDSINETTKNEFKVVWTGTENFSNNCEIFTVTFKAKDNYSGTSNIICESSNDDTFNEKWDDVKISSDIVQINIENENQQSFWSKIVDFFKMICNFFKSLFV